MANYTNSVVVCQFSYTPDTPPSICHIMKHVRMIHCGGSRNTKCAKTALNPLSIIYNRHLVICQWYINQDRLIEYAVQKKSKMACRKYKVAFDSVL